MMTLEIEIPQEEIERSLTRTALEMFNSGDGVWETRDHIRKFLRSDECKQLVEKIVRQLLAEKSDEIIFPVVKTTVQRQAKRLLEEMERQKELI